MLHKLHRFQINPRLDRSRIDVVRHRLTSRFTARGRVLAVAGSALACFGFASLAVNPAPPASSPAAGLVSAEALDERRAAAAGTDRGERRSGAQQNGEGAGQEAGEPDGEASGLPDAPADQAGADQPDGDRPAPDAADDESDRPDQAEQKQAEQKQAEQKRKKPAQKKPAQKANAQKKPWVHPMPGAATTSCFGARWGTMHAGVDLAAPPGTPIRTVGDGRVAYAGWVFPGYGISVVVKHKNGVLTHYAHASKAKVSPGQKVKAGQVVALEGSTGDSSGPHLHFEVHKGLWNQVEPTKWLAKRGVKIKGC